MRAVLRVRLPRPGRGVHAPFKPEARQARVERPLGLFSPEFQDAAWSIPRVIDMLKHIWIPVLVIGTAGTAGLIRVMRGNLLDVLEQQYVQTARSKGLTERVVVYKHAARNALHPLVMQLGMQLPEIFSGAAITSVVLNLPTLGEAYLTAVQAQDMFLAGSFLLIITALLIVGNIVADVLLASGASCPVQQALCVVYAALTLPVDETGRKVCAGDRRGVGDRQGELRAVRP